MAKTGQECLVLQIEIHIPTQYYVYSNNPTYDVCL